MSGVVIAAAAVQDQGGEKRDQEGARGGRETRVRRPSTWGMIRVTEDRVDQRRIQLKKKNKTKCKEETTSHVVDVALVECLRFVKFCV